jgi:hypothetical protein
VPAKAAGVLSRKAKLRAVDQNANMKQMARLAKSKLTKDPPDFKCTMEETKSQASEKPISIHSTPKGIANQGNSIVHTKGRDTPRFLRPITDRYAFGNTHMALMVGPLIIENGVPQ